MVKATWEKIFAVFVDSLQTVKIFSTNFILSTNMYAKVVFLLVKIKTVKVFPSEL